MNVLDDNTTVILLFYTAKLEIHLCTGVIYTLIAIASREID